jgi:RHS repeat-associated protein
VSGSPQSGFQTTSDYILGPAGEQVSEMSVSATATANCQANIPCWLHTNVYAAGTLIATYDTTGKGLHFYFNDPLGSRRAQTDAFGLLEQTCASLPFGDGLSCTGSTTAPTEHHFTAKERDTESGNDYFEARYLGSSMGRFLSPDPVGGSLANPQTLNKYAYVLNNPLTNTDPTGLYACKDGKDGACSSDQDKAYEASRQRDLQSKNADVRRGAAAMGDPGKEVVNARGDKVTVGFADLGKSGEGGVTHSELGSNDKGDPISVSNVTINSNSRGTALDADVGHEGSHVADAQDMAGSITYTSTSFHVGQDISQYASEQRAYRVTDAIYRSANESYNGCGNANCALGAGSSPIGINGRIDSILRANPGIYHGPDGRPLTPQNPGGNVLSIVVPH